ncbi:hypothetical protein [Azotobacter beijerinckii]|uniref:hypothetical protein n=1 Tax=Azotobacter beijerinckii TaxID=170623 RepID=UPI0029535813|nr:hypothetical protein [Azotobacter beijerinckii]MDV7212926.1 hypothetical protein [Azotobacter beijerinckii]
MDKFYGLLDWLDVSQAIDFLSVLTGRAIDQGQLMVLCRHNHCNAYLDSPPPDGKSILPETGAFCATMPSGVGHHLIKWPHPHQWEDGQKIRFCLQGKVRQFDFFKGEPLLNGPDRFGSREVEDCDWFVELSETNFEPRFKRSDIELLGAKMNVGAGRSGMSRTQAQAEKGLGTAHAPSGNSKPISKACRQDQAVIEMLRQLGYEPKDLPERPAGRKGAKTDVWSELSNRKDLFTERSFSKTWDRLRASGDIVGGK